MRVLCMCGCIEQWNLYVPGLIGAAKVVVPRPSTLALKLVPSSAVTVCPTLSMFLTVILVPALTVSGAPNANDSMVIVGPATTAGADALGVLAAGGFVGEAVLAALPPQAAVPTASMITGTTARTGRGVMLMTTCDRSRRFIESGLTRLAVQPHAASAGVDRCSRSRSPPRWAALLH